VLAVVGAARCALSALSCLMARPWLNPRAVAWAAASPPRGHGRADRRRPRRPDLSARSGREQRS